MGGSLNWLQKQVEYYRRRAPEYDATMRPAVDSLKEQEAVLLAALREFEPKGRVLEIACGTGFYTMELVPFADAITAVDASPEMLAIARSRVDSERVQFVEADVFTWEPDGQYDVVFFSFWLSHVPPSHFERFWGRMATFLRPGGRVFFMDEGRHTPWLDEYVDEAAGVVRRELQDGTEHFAIKVLWDAAELEERLRSMGWNIVVNGAGALYWGHGGRSSA